MDLTPEFKELRLPSIRLHDCHWPNTDVVDIHTIFPNFHANPADSSSYQFDFTDTYLAACAKTGAPIVYRLGESIEHTALKRFVRPPKSSGQWAAICVGIIRHYNDGWAGGFQLGITHWEIWNEPENRPAMWTGNDDQFLELYRITSKKIKDVFPYVKVGGPAFGSAGEFRNAEIIPSKFAARFLERCRDEKAPLDFFSWHCYTDDPAELAGRAKAIRKLLDGYGFSKTESHLNEWNYLPGKSWEGLGKETPATKRQAYYETMSGMDGAAFAASALIVLQDAPVDTCNFFHGEAGGFGLFNEYGVPNDVYRAFKLFSECQKNAQRAPLMLEAGSSSKLSALSGWNREARESSTLISNRGDAANIEVKCPAALVGNAAEALCEIELLRGNGKTETQRFPISSQGGFFAAQLFLDGPGVALVRLRVR
jgi:hypothetical protein